MATMIHAKGYMANDKYKNKARTQRWRSTIRSHVIAQMAKKQRAEDIRDFAARYPLIITQST